MDVSGLPASLSAVFKQTLPSSLKPPKVTPLPQPEISPVPASSASTSSGPSISAFSVNVQLLQISIRQQSNGNTQVDVVKQQLKLFRAEVKSTVKDAVASLDEEAKQTVDQLLKRFSSNLKPKRNDDSDDDRDRGTRRAERKEGPAPLASILTNVQSALEGLIDGLQRALQGDDLQQIVTKLQDLFKQLGDRLQRSSDTTTTPRDEETEVQTAENSPESSGGQANSVSAAFSFSLTALSVQASYQRVQSL